MSVRLRKLNESWGSARIRKVHSGARSSWLGRHRLSSELPNYLPNFGKCQRTAGAGPNNVCEPWWMTLSRRERMAAFLRVTGSAKIIHLARSARRGKRTWLALVLTTARRRKKNTKRLEWGKKQVQAREKSPSARGKIGSCGVRAIWKDALAGSC